MIRKSVLLLGLVSLLIAPAGCIFSPSSDDGGDGGGGGSVELPFPGTPEQLMANFKTIYESMDIEGYRNLLHPDYQTILKESTVQDFPSVGATLDYTEEVQIAENMFSGAPGHDANGDLTSSISSITFTEPDQVTPWEPATAWPEYFDYDNPNYTIKSSLFNVLFEFNRAGDTTLQVTGLIKFFIAEQDSLYQGAVRPYYQMIGQEDLTNDGK